MTDERLAEIEMLHAREPAPPWAGELLEEVRRLRLLRHVAYVDVNVCPGCHRVVVGAPGMSDADAMLAHQQAHNQGRRV